MAEEQVKVPDIGGAEGAEVIELLVEVGDTVEVDQSLLVLESDKASMEIPSSLAGTVKEVLVKVGDELAEGAPIAVIETGNGEDAAREGSSDTGSEDDGETEAAESSSASKTSGQSKQSEKATSKAEADDDAAGDEEAAEKDKKAEPGGKEAGKPDAGGQEEDGPREVTVDIPDIGTDDAVDLIEFCVQVGDDLDEGDSLVVLESDKASMEVPSPQAGKLVKWLVKEGGTVRQGDQLAVLEVSGSVSDKAEKPAEEGSAEQGASEKSGSQPDASASASGQSGKGKAAPGENAGTGAGKAAASTAGGGATSQGGAGEELVYAGPAVRKLAREFGVDIAQVVGTGPRDRILKEDVQAYVQRALSNSPGGTAATGGAGIPAIPEVDFAAFGEVESVPRSKMDKLTAANMHRSWLNVPHVTQWDDADITELEAFRASLKREAEQRGTRLTPVPFLLKACALALRDNPKFNASLSADGEQLVYKQYFHIGMAVDTPAGLLVPVIRDVDQKSLWELAEEVLDMAARARDRKLKPQEMQGGCFSVSSLGSIGGRGFTPIVNAPEVGILGVSRASVQPVWDGEAFQPRTQLPLALSYDHRVVNGADAGRFLTQLVGLLGDIRRLLL